MKSTDSETGETELVNYRILNPETGELIRENGINCAKKAKFQIPKSFLQSRASFNDHGEKEQKCCLLATKETYTLTRKEKVINLQEVNMQNKGRIKLKWMLIVQLSGNHHRSQQDKPSNVLDTYIDILATNFCDHNHHCGNCPAHMGAPEEFKSRQLKSILLS
jgi:hypothetical protein